MSKILLYLLVLFFFFLFVFSLRKKLGKKFKPFLIILVTLCIIFAVLFELNSSKKSHKKEELIVAFNQGKSLICGDIFVTNANFNYEFGTSSLISKDDNQSLKALVFAIKDCELINE